MSHFDDFDDFVVVDFETKNMPDAKLLRRTGKKTFINATKRERIEEFIKTLPSDGETFHIVSNGRFDYYSFVSVLISKLGVIDNFYASTWTMNRENVTDLIARFDAGQIAKITLFMGTYFKRREPSIYATILDGLTARAQRFICFENHTKIMLFESNNKFFVIEGSANFTANPRFEQNILCQSEALYRFHQDWMEGMFKKK